MCISILEPLTLLSGKITLFPLSVTKLTEALFISITLPVTPSTVILSPTLNKKIRHCGF